MVWIMILFWLCAALVVYHHVGYPLLLKYVGKRAGGRVTPPLPVQRGFKAEASDAALPTITLVMPIYNEAATLAAKLQNLASLDYPANKLSIHLHFDGCSDESYPIALCQLGDPALQQLHIRLFDHPCNRGKVAVLNEAMTHIESDLVALTDVSALLPIDSLLLAVAHFQDPEIGVVGEAYRFWQPGSQGEESYWHYQSQIKLCESALGSMLGAHGAFYMMRRECLTPLAADTINDDFMLPMMAIAKGYKAVYDNRCSALELEVSDALLEAQRRKRIGAGNTQQLLRLLPLLHPRFGWVAFNFASGKGLRVLMPLCLTLLWLCAIPLATQSMLFQALLVLQLLGYLLVTLIHLTPLYSWPTLFRKIHYLVLGHWYNGIGTLRYGLRMLVHPTTQERAA
ncbi:glycosyltransferase family 2 protein [Aeromonas popoffii]|jgi:cellulose synthase/poly-beta-1,6-N-acetylglucosamine synthase-like glycosyltransferase|uniref:glycosyltransferase family 2 protein n=1 Tax=Aeromonas popoffii TaxID=70856 RepID=UPI0005A606A3|nr:glycosyltransferase family 2 protein [Aeromonas popoffii]